MIEKRYTNIDVVTMARIRIKNIFETANRVEFSVSGGKDSICLNDILFNMCLSGEIDKNKLLVCFIDEEAIYPCIEENVMNIRNQWLSIGVEFIWFCIQVKHYNCFNSLVNDENFICWDENKKDVWIRKKPPFAVTSHPLLDERHDTYQAFMTKLTKNMVTITGVRIAESIQRMYNVASRKGQEMQYPIYDWEDHDVWFYIQERGLYLPEAYIYMYQVGVRKNNLRISQFFSVDTARSLVQMCEFYPDLFDKICKREPNAYMAMLYYDTELFRHQKGGSKKEKDETDYKKKVFETLNESWRYVTDNQIKSKKACENLIIDMGEIMLPKHWKTIYNILIGGDPKGRAYRALQLGVYKYYRQEVK